MSVWPASSRLREVGAFEGESPLGRSRQGRSLWPSKSMPEAWTSLRPVGDQRKGLLRLLLLLKRRASCAHAEAASAAKLIPIPTARRSRATLILHTFMARLSLWKFVLRAKPYSAAGRSVRQ